jgi:uncharacterized protein YabN with tetrapyrrole methylase and pyrophosphatase domain
VSGSLVVVGTGIGPAQLTTEARAAIAAADRVFFAAGDLLTEAELGELNANASTLAGFFENGNSRRQAYEDIVEAILAPARSGMRVCAAFYGHPGMFVLPAGEAIRRARSEGIAARMLPGVSSLDCLFADLGVDPAAAGLQMYEAGEFVHRQPTVEPRAGLVLWQVGVVRSQDELAAALRSWYPETHEVVVYEASSYPGMPPRADPFDLERLVDAELTPRSTLYVPPLASP